MVSHRRISSALSLLGDRSRGISPIENSVYRRYIHDISKSHHYLSIFINHYQAIRGHYDKQGYHNPGLITDELIEYIYTSARQPNSRFAIASQETKDYFIGQYNE